MLAEAALFFHRTSLCRCSLLRVPAAPHARMDSPKLWLRDEVFEHGILHPSGTDPKKVSLAVMAPLLAELRDLATPSGDPEPYPRARAAVGLAATAVRCVTCAGSGGGV